MSGIPNTVKCCIRNQHNMIKFVSSFDNRITYKIKIQYISMRLMSIFLFYVTNYESDHRISFQLEKIHFHGCVFKWLHLLLPT